MDVEQMVEEVDRLGWRVNNIFQCHDGQWQCNLWQPDGPPGERTTQWAAGKTIRQAVHAALMMLRNEVRARRQMAATTIPPRPLTRRRTT